MLLSQAEASLSLSRLHGSTPPSLVNASLHTPFITYRETNQEQVIDCFLIKTLPNMQAMDEEAQISRQRFHGSLCHFEFGLQNARPRIGVSMRPFCDQQNIPLNGRRADSGHRRRCEERLPHDRHGLLLHIHEISSVANPSFCTRIRRRWARASRSASRRDW